MKIGLFSNNQNNLSDKNNSIKKTDYLASRALNSGLRQDTVNFSGKGKMMPWVKQNPGKTAGIGGTIAATLTGAAYAISSIFGGTGAATNTTTTPTQTPSSTTPPSAYIETFTGTTAADILEDYDTVNDIFLPEGNTLKIVEFKPHGLPEGVVMQNIVSSEEAEKDDDPRIGATLRQLIERANYDYEGTYKAHGIGNSAIDEDADVDTEGAFHATIDKYLQSNPELVALITTVNKVDSIDELTPDEIADTVLFSGKDLLTSTRVIVPSFEIPYADMDKTDNKVANRVIQKQFAPDEADTRIDIISNSDKLKEGQYSNLKDGIIDILHLDVNDKDFDTDFDAILRKIATAPENAHIIEVKTGDLREGDKINVLDDDARVEVLLGLESIEGLYIPDNIVINTIVYDNNNAKYDYKAGSTIYSISPICPIDGESVREMQLPAAIDPNFAKPNDITCLNDVLKFFYDTRTNEAFMYTGRLSIQFL